MTEVTLPTPTPGTAGEHAFHTASKTFIDEAGRDGAKVANRIAESINVLDHGAVGDEVANDYTAIMEAHAEALAAGEGSTLLFPAGYRFAAGTSLVFSRLLNVIMESPVVFTAVGIALTIGEPSLKAARRTYKLWAERQTQSTWASEADIVMKLINFNHCSLHVVDSAFGTIGVQEIGDGQGFAYNQVQLGILNGNKIGVDCTNINGGWCNENKHQKGRFTVPTGVNSALQRIGVRVTSQDLGSVNNNGNVFAEPSFELNASDATGEALPILVEHGMLNRWENIRNENNDAITIRTQNASQRNKVTVHYSSVAGQRDDQGTQPSSHVSGGATLMTELGVYDLWKSGPLHKLWCYANGSTTINVPTVALGTSADAALSSAVSLLVPAADYLEIPATRSAGIFVKTTKCKRFVAHRDVETGRGGRVMIRCYDAAGAVLTDAGAGHPYVKKDSGTTIVWITTFGGAYRTAADTDGPLFFEVGPDVASVYIAVTGGTNPAQLRSLSLKTLEPVDGATWTGAAHELNVGSTPPTAGTFERGRRMLVGAPVAGGFEGYVQVADPPTQTWKGFGAIEA